MHLSLLALTVLLAGTALSNPSLVKRDMTLAKRVPQYTTPPGCHANNVLRALRNTKVASSASVFCSTYIQPTTRITATATFSDTIIVETITPLATSTDIEFLTEVSVLTITTTPAVVFNKRQATALPSYVSQYSPSEVSSACSCFIPLPSPATSVIGESTTSTILDTSTAETSTTVVRTISIITTTTSTLSSLPTQTCAASKIGCVSENSVTVGTNATTANECYTICGQTPGCVAFQYRVVSLATNCNLLGVSAAQAFLSNTGNAGTGDKCNTAHIYDFHTPPC